jgi:curved DNA-binding protein CbpA
VGVTPGASLDEVRAAYRAQAVAMHPDANRNLSAAEQQGLQERFKEITAAYNAVKDNITSRAQDAPSSSAGEERLLSGTTVAPMPRGETGGGRAAEDSSRRDSVAKAREALGDYGGGGSYSGGYESRFREEDPEEADNEPTSNESSSNTKPKTEGPANNIVSARGLRDNNKKPDPRQEGMKRAASVAGDGVSANEILAETGIDATEAEMRAAKNNIVRLKRAATPTPTSPKSRR